MRAAPSRLSGAVLWLLLAVLGGFFVGPHAVRATEPADRSPAPLQFTGAPTLDPCLVFLRARVYQPCTGRFLQHDPLDTTRLTMPRPQGANRWVYAANNPLRFIDPTGLMPQLPIIGGPMMPAPSVVLNPQSRMHIDRNQFNQCWSTPPQPTGDGGYADPVGVRWAKDPDSTTSVYHGGLDVWRRGHDQCAYVPPAPPPAYQNQPPGTLITSGGDEGTYDYCSPYGYGPFLPAQQWFNPLSALCHLAQDVLPHTRNPHYTPNLTHVLDATCATVRAAMAPPTPQPQPGPSGPF